MQPYYEYRHIVGLEETNLVGNVYFVNHIRWQGRCREMFLKDHAPGVMRRLLEDLSLVTVSCACNYFSELTALDEISVRLYLQDLAQNRIALRFEYWRVNRGPGELIAEGNQEIACMRRVAGALEVEEVPAELRRALAPYRC
ncbi:MAG: acyl-CoA thioesterase [Acidobacteriaceae bacterium]|nr:acyl-CoA thioesterase [Acidobacteriaceae bacterium]